ncbi:DUF29 domain-containing protein [Microseira wollei]|uniref:DUF29 domain-containing protein n=1 Tax=Microseira wollei NIES-4236 TaxID=2530354 RepID=A0AAV3XJ15_9CYAN|nr:DUF29 domain-containing protein [Microseira wollei]GET41885.1 hypothetical protein MiSe_66990 [Microseira wollei NIES-4236]
MKSVYETDFYAWTQEQVKLLKEQAWHHLDVLNLIEELEDLGRRERQELRNCLGLLLGHLLKWQYQPSNRSNSWLATIREQRREVNLLLKDNPSLKSYLPEALPIADQSGLDLAVRETGIAYDAFPTECPYLLVEQVLDDTFLPEL